MSIVYPSEHVTLSPPAPSLLIFNPHSRFSIKISFPNNSKFPTMADRQASPGQSQRPPRPTTTIAASSTTSFLRKMHEHAPNSVQLIGFLTLVISGGILLLLTGLTLTATVLGLIFFTPLIIISSPIWVPAGSILFVIIAGVLSFLGFGVGVAASFSWLYRYFRGFHPPGSDQVDYARSRIVDTAREYGGYLHGKVKDAAPGA